MKPKPEPPIFDTLIAALSAPRPSDAPGGLATMDLADRLHWSMGKIRQELRALMKAGQLVSKVEMRIGIDGKPHHTPVYSIKGKRA